MQDTKRYQCRHILTDGHRCGSPCLRHEEFCYYHHTTRRPIQNPSDRKARQTEFDLPLPEDRAAIQTAIGEVLSRIARNEIDPKRAGLLLHGLQIASANLPRQVTTPARTNPRTYRNWSSRDRTYRESDRPTENPSMVEEIVLDPTYGTLAPRAELTKPEERQSYIGALLELLKEDPEDSEPAPEKSAADAAKAHDTAPAQLTPANPREPLNSDPNVLEPEAALNGEELAIGRTHPIIAQPAEPAAEPTVLPTIQATQELLEPAIANERGLRKENRRLFSTQTIPEPTLLVSTSRSTILLLTIPVPTTKTGPIPPTAR